MIILENNQPLLKPVWKSSCCAPAVRAIPWIGGGTSSCSSAPFSLRYGTGATSCSRQEQPELRSASRCQRRREGAPATGPAAGTGLALFSGLFWPGLRFSACFFGGAVCLFVCLWKDWTRSQELSSRPNHSEVLESSGKEVRVCFQSCGLKGWFSNSSPVFQTPLATFAGTLLWWRANTFWIQGREGPPAHGLTDRDQILALLNKPKINMLYTTMKNSSLLPGRQQQSNSTHYKKS